MENDSFEVAESQAIMSRLQWDGSSDISPSDSASSKASECLGWGQILQHSPSAGANPALLASPQHGRGQTDRQTAAVQSHHNPQGRGGHPLVLGCFFLGVDWWGGAPVGPAVPQHPISSLSPPGTNNSESRKTKKKKPHLGLVSGAPGLGSSKKKKPKPPPPHTPSIYDDIN